MACTCGIGACRVSSSSCDSEEIREKCVKAALKIYELNLDNVCCQMIKKVGLQIKLKKYVLNTECFFNSLLEVNLKV